MPTPRQFQSYPKEYTVLFKKAFNEPVSISFESNYEAKRFRLTMYAFRRAILAPESGADEILILKSPLISFNINGKTLTVVLPKRISNVRKALQHARAIAAGRQS